jgi:hypothetical protein
MNEVNLLESLPKDIIRLILKHFLSNEDAIKCFLTIQIFHKACDEITLKLLKRSYFFNISKFAPKEDHASFMKNEHKSCKCGVIYKNNTHRCLVKELIPEFCPDCSKRLIGNMKYNDSEWVYIHWLHFKHKERYCITHSKTLQDICRNRKKKAANTKKELNEKTDEKLALLHRKIVKKERLKDDKKKRNFNNSATLTIIYLMGSLTLSLGVYSKLKSFF